MRSSNQAQMTKLKSSIYLSGLQNQLNYARIQYKRSKTKANKDRCKRIYKAIQDELNK